MTTDTREVLSALVDGEPVDAEVLAAALEVPASRALLVDFVRLRGSVQADDHPAPEWRADHVSSRGLAPSPWSRGWLRAAAVVALLTAGALGGTWIENIRTRERPPEPTRVVQLQLVNGR